MVGVIILYDHVHPVGAFAKNSGIDVSVSLVFLFPGCTIISPPSKTIKPLTECEKI